MQFLKIEIKGIASLTLFRMNLARCANFSVLSVSKPQLQKIQVNKHKWRTRQSKLSTQKE